MGFRSLVKFKMQHNGRRRWRGFHLLLSSRCNVVVRDGQRGWRGFDPLAFRFLNRTFWFLNRVFFWVSEAGDDLCQLAQKPASDGCTACHEAVDKCDHDSRPEHVKCGPFSWTLIST